MRSDHVCLMKLAGPGEGRFYFSDIAEVPSPMACDCRTFTPEQGCSQGAWLHLHCFLATWAPGKAARAQEPALLLLGREQPTPPPLPGARPEELWHCGGVDYCGNGQMAVRGRRETIVKTKGMGAS